jgi:general secretion pathway protein B
MSYILDALRRAEAERERGAVPSLQSQQHTVIEEDDTAPRSRRLMWVIVGLGGALLALLAWTFFGGSTPPSRPAVEGLVAPTVVAPAVVAPPPPNVALPVTTETAPAPVPARVAAPTVASAAAPPVATQVVPPAPTAVRPPAVAAAEERRPARRVPSASAATLAAAPAASAPRIYAQGELPEDVRRDLPRIAINGSSYSGDAASRMVMINGQIFHEGDSLGAGLQLEKINRRSAVLVFRGWRYEVAF